VEGIQLHMIYGNLNRRIRKRVSRDKFTTYETLLANARQAEKFLNEKPAEATSSENKVERSRHVEKKHYPEKVTKKDDMKSTRREISCYGCGAPGVIRARCEVCKNKKVASSAEDFASSYSTRVKSRPMFRIYIEGKRGLALADSGATGCVASRTLTKIFEENGHSFENKQASITYANGKTETSMVRKTTADVVIQGRKIKTTFTCLDNGVEGRTILGCDFLEAADIVMDVKRRNWYFAGNGKKMYPFV